jgi:2-polyprenyl-6-methoxyphenol hydroxylase-like FAD-dependent oxidoreductase
MGAPRQVDVLVAGGGPAGSATALGLRKAGWQVALVERSRFDAARVGESLSPRIAPALRRLGVWDAFLALGPRPTHEVRSLWGGSAVETRSHLLSAHGPGWVVERVGFDRMLFEAARAREVETLLGAEVEACAPRDGGWAVRIGGNEVWARFLVDASGRRTALARFLGARRAVFDRMVALVTELVPSREGEGAPLLVEATSDGWWYSAPLPGDLRVLVLMTDGDLLRPGDYASRAGFARALDRTTATKTYFRPGPPAAEPRITSAASHRLLRTAREGASGSHTTRLRPWLAVGDAALSVDPLAGEGVVLALASGEAAAQVITAHLRGNAHALLGHEATLDARCTRILRERMAYYGLECRFRSPFWRRRAVARASGTSSEPRDLVRTEA